VKTHQAVARLSGLKQTEEPFARGTIYEKRFTELTPLELACRVQLPAGDGQETSAAFKLAR